MTAPSQQAAVRREVDGATLRLTLTAPDRLNAVTRPTMAALAEALTDLPDEVRVVLLAGEGRAFCAGADLAVKDAEVDLSTDLQTARAGMEVAAGLVRAIVAAPVPVVAQVQGPAAGVGASFALAADLTIMSTDAYFLLPFVHVGLMPDGGATLTAAAGMGRARAMRAALLGERILADEAYAAGLVSEVVSPDELDGRVEDVLAQLAAGPQRALASTKRAINAATIGDLSAALDRENDEQAVLLTSPDFREGVRAFMERRPPAFRDARPE